MGNFSDHRKVKPIYEYVRNHLREWFLKLPAYATYIQRLNRLPQDFAGLLSVIQNDFPLLSQQKHIFLIDSMPIMTAHAQRSSRAKVAMPSRKGIVAALSFISCCPKKQKIPPPDYIEIIPTSTADIDISKRHCRRPV